MLCAKDALCASAIALISAISTDGAAAQTGDRDDVVVAAAPASVISLEIGPEAVTKEIVLPTGTPILVMLGEELSTQTSSVGDRFSVTVLSDIAIDQTIVIPQGTTGFGEVTFVTKKGAFGKPGILGIALRSLDLDGQSIALDGRYREEGRSNSGATAATMLVVGVFAGLIQGRMGVMPKGRELNARIGEDSVIRISPVAPVSSDGASVEPSSVVQAGDRPAVPNADAGTTLLPATASDQ